MKQMYQRISVFLLIAISIMASAYARPDAVGADVRVTLLNQEPDPVEPGQYVMVRFLIENLGSIQVDDFSMMMIDQYPFSIDANQDRQIIVGSLGAFQSIRERAVVEYRVRVDSGALQGDTSVRVSYSYVRDGRSISIEREFSLRVRTPHPSIAIREVSVSPQRLVPGNQGMVTIRLENTAPTDLRDVTVSLNLLDLPFAPIGSSTQKRIALLRSGEMGVVQFNIQLYPSADEGVYKIPLLLSFVDSLNNRVDRTDMIGVVVGVQPTLISTVGDHGLFVGFTRGNVPIRIINTGVGDAKFLRIDIASTDAFDLLSPPSLYVGHLDSDDFESIDIRISNNDESATSLVIPVTLHYQDTNFISYEQELLIRVALPPERLVNGQGTGGVFVIGVIVLVVIIGAVWMLRRRRKDDHEDQ